MADTGFIRQAVIFAGGRGERLRPITDTIPKPMAPVRGLPFLDYLVHSLVSAGIVKVLFLVGYKSSVIMERYKDNLNGQVKFEYSVGTVEDDTGRRLLNAYSLLDERFLLLYGDNYWPMQLQDMVALYKDKKAAALTTVFSNKNGTGEYGRENNVQVGQDGYVEFYDKSRQSPGLNGVDIGYFLLSKEKINPHIEGNVSFERDILPGFIKGRQLAAYVTDAQYYFITTLASLKQFENFVCDNNIGHI